MSIMKNDYPLHYCSECSPAEEHHDCHGYKHFKSPPGCVEGILAALKAISYAVSAMCMPGYSVDVDILLKDGTTHRICFGHERVRLSCTLLQTDCLAISLCDIVKLHVLPPSAMAAQFYKKLKHALGCGLDNCCSYPPEELCQREMQEFILRHMNEIEEVSLTGASKTIQTVTVPTQITTAEVLTSASLTTHDAQVLTGANIETDSKFVTASVTPAAGTVVSELTQSSVSALRDVTGTTTPVSAPVTLSATNVVTSVSPIAVPSVLTGLTLDKADVVNSLEPTYINAVTGFSEPTTVTGVVSGLNSVSTITPIAKELPLFSGNGTGLLQVIIPAGGLSEPGDPPFPATQKVFNVTVGGTGATLSYLGNSEIFTLPTSANVLGGFTSRPQVSTIAQTGAPIINQVLKQAVPHTVSVVREVHPESAEGSLLGNVTSGSVNSVSAQPATIHAISALVKTPETFNAVGTVTNTPIHSLFSTSTTEVLTEAEIELRTTSVVADAYISEHKTTVVKEIGTKELEVSVNAPEEIDGDVKAVGCGIMAVDNDDGSLSVYSICDINSAQTCD